LALQAAFASAPALSRVSLVGVRGEGLARVPVYFGEFQRDAVDSTEPVDLLTGAAESRINLRGRTQEVAAIELPQSRAVQRVVAAQGLPAPARTGRPQGSTRP